MMGRRREAPARESNPRRFAKNRDTMGNTCDGTMKADHDASAISVPRKAARLPPPEPQPPHLRFYMSSVGYQAIMSWYDEVLATIDTPVESVYVDTRFGRTHMLAAGRPDAEPLFLIPGVAGCAPLWRRQFRMLAEHFRVYGLDIPGQPGRSDPNPPSFLNDDYVHWLVDVLDGLNLQRASFAGVSVGAWVAMRMGVTAPERVNKVIMMGPTGLSHASLPWKIWLTRVMRKSKDANVLEQDLTAKSVTSRSPGGTFGTFDRTLARAMALCTRHYRVDRSLGIYNDATHRVEWGKGLRVLRLFFLSEPRALLQRFRGVDGMLVFGEHEVLYDPAKVAARARKLMGDLRVEIVPGAGHAAIYDKPDEVNQMIIDYLKAPRRA
jgi:pimeloyl-ACP methyl ester carboxylesterase